MFRTLLLFVLGVVVGAVGLSACSARSVPPPSPPVARAESPASPDLRISVYKNYLTEQMAANLKGDPNVGDPALDLLPPDQVRITVSLHLQIMKQDFSLRPSLLMRLGVANGRVQVTPQGVEIKGAELPSMLVEEPMNQAAKDMEEQINSSLSQVEQGSGLKLQAVSVTTDALTLDFAK